jgi:hypothetical protein
VIGGAAAGLGKSLRDPRSGRRTALVRSGEAGEPTAAPTFIITYGVLFPRSGIGLFTLSFILFSVRLSVEFIVMLPLMEEIDGFYRNREKSVAPDKAVLGGFCF